MCITTDNGPAATWPAIDAVRVHELLDTLLDEFIWDFDKTPVRKQQELRGFLISWISVFMLDEVRPEFTRRLTGFWIECRYNENWRWHGWFRLCPIEPAVSHLWGLELAPLISNINHDSCSLREPVHLALAFLVGRLRIDDAEFRGRVESSLRHSLLDSDRAIALFIAAEGALEEKRAWAAQQLRTMQLNRSERAILQRVAGSLPSIPNPFADAFAEVERYGLIRLAGTHTGVPGAQPPSGPGVQMHGDELFARLRQHPLAGACIAL